MAKMIKCPTCGTQIEVPAGQGPQVIKCPGCGKGLKIVAKKPAPPPGIGPGGSLAGGSMAGTVAGGSISAMSVHDEPAPKDDLPSLDTNCEVCGRVTAADDLIEDNGRMVCPDCIKGARSRIDRPDEAPDLLDFKRPLPAARRGKLIRVTPGFVGVCTAAVVFISCQIYLTLIESPRGKGRAMASPVGPAHVTPATPPAGSESLLNPPATQAATQTSESTGITNPAPPQPSPPPGVAANPPAAPPGVAPLPPDATPPIGEKPTPAPAAAAPGSILFPNEPDTQPPAPPATPPAEPAPPPIVPVVPGSPRPAIAALPSNDPLKQGIDKLQERDYKAAFAILDQPARQKYHLLGRLVDPLTPEQQMVLVGLAAANLGRNKPEVALSQLSIVVGTPQTSSAAAKPGIGQRTRSAVLNYAIAVLTKKPVAPAEMQQAVTLLGEYLQRGRGDEYAADVFGTLLERASVYPNSSAFLQPYVLQLDTYANELALSDPKHSGQLKWGVEWKDRALVVQYRASRGRGAVAATPEQLQQELEAAKAKVLTLKQAVDTAKANGGDVYGAQNQYRDALASLADVQMRIEAAAAPAPKAKWLEKFAPVVPEGMTVVQ